MNNVAVVLAGCGVYDGAEIQEAILALHALEELGVSYQCYAPDKKQAHVIDHTKGEPVESESRNVLRESARIVRGDVKPLTELNASEYDGLLVPGGFGVAKNLSDLAFKGDAVTIDIEFEKVMKGFKEAQKPAGYICIAPALLPKVYPNVKCTIGNDIEFAAIIKNLGGEHVECAVDGTVIDVENKVISTPAYMIAENMLDAGKGIRKLVSELVKM